MIFVIVLERSAPYTHSMSSNHEEPWIDSPEQRQALWGEHIAVGLHKIHLAMRMKTGSSQTALRAFRSQTLAVLGMQERPDATPEELAGRLGVTVSLIQRMLRHLERRGLIGRQAQDGGLTGPVRLTAKGRRKAARLRQWPELVAATAPQLSGSHQDTLLRTVERMISSLVERGDISITKMCTPCKYFRPHAHEDPQRPHHCVYIDEPLPTTESEDRERDGTDHLG